MQLKKPGVDIINDILELVMAAFPQSAYFKNLHHQYHERGGLSKKQLEDLFIKAKKTDTVTATKLATLEAEILKRPTRYKSALPSSTPLYKKDPATAALIKEILDKYPQHKRVLFLKGKYENNETLTTTEVRELEKFNKMLK